MHFLTIWVVLQELLYTSIMTNLIKTICLTLQADFGNPNTHPHNKNKTKTVFYASPEDFTFFNLKIWSK